MNLLIFFLFFKLALFAHDVDTVPVAYKGGFHPLSYVAKDRQESVENLFLHEDLLLLPKNEGGGKWVSLNKISLDSENFTLYPDKDFQRIKKSYLLLKKNYSEKKEQHLARQLKNAYQHIAGTPYLETLEHKVYYPSFFNIKMENFYLQYSLSFYIILLYACASVLFFFKLKVGIVFLSLAFLVHSSDLLLRCFILGRAPVSNMFETLLYVPWMIVFLSFIFYYKYRDRSIFLASSIGAFLLLLILKLSSLADDFSPVQPVLNSQYWLIIHVLMVVGSYGAFFLSSLLAHIYLIGFIKHKKEQDYMKSIHKLVLQTTYLGISMLIPGTILGGVWAMESWGRFWDWDPKESWAFISIMIYLIWIHAYRFNKISHFGLQLGAVIGFLSISFTWYGVNYILGTGLHSYGFGSGGGAYYLLFFATEVCFLICIGTKALANKEKIM